MNQMQWPSSSFKESLCRCTDMVIHRLCPIHGRHSKPELYIPRAVAKRLLGKTQEICRVCRQPIHQHSTGNYFHCISVDPFHKAVP